MYYNTAARASVVQHLSKIVELLGSVDDLTHDEERALHNLTIERTRLNHALLHRDPRKSQEENAA